MVISDEIFDRCWFFIRGDTSAQEFESWVYKTTELQPLFGEDFYMTLISTDYSSTGPVFVLKRELQDVISGSLERDCYCHTLPNLADVGMGEHNHIFKSLHEKAKYGDPLWWLWLAECEACNQFWMIGSEERINDVFVMSRLSSSTAQKILNESIWPDDFKTFESLLRIGRERGHSVRFLDPLCHSLVSTVIDLAAAKPEITVTEISELLQISLEHTKAVISEAMKDSFIKIAL